MCPAVPQLQLKREDVYAVENSFIIILIRTLGSRSFPTKDYMWHMGGVKIICLVCHLHFKMSDIKVSLSTGCFHGLKTVLNSIHCTIWFGSSIQ